MQIKALNIFVALLGFLSSSALAQRYGYYGGYSFFGNQAACGGNRFNTITCNRYTVAAGFCSATQPCTTAGYVCIAPGVCCPSPTATNSCPTGLPTGFSCAAGGICATGSVCFVPTGSVNGICCVGNVVTNACPNGSTGAGQCIATQAGLQCGAGFACTTLGGQNICCPTAARGGGTNPTASLTNTVCQNNQMSTTSKCTVNGHCSGFGVNSYCYNGFCCSVGATFRNAPANQTQFDACDGGAEPSSGCDRENKKCKKNHTCNERTWFCCPNA